MELKKSSIPTNTVTRKLTDLDAPTGNIYKSVVIIARRANQISSEIKQELTRKLADFRALTTRWKRLSRTANRSKYRNITNACRNRRS